MTLIDEILFIKEFDTNNNFQNDHIITFISKFNLFSSQTINAIFHKLDTSSSDFFFFCGRCLSEGLIHELLIPNLDKIHSINSLIHAYNVLLLSNNPLRIPLGEKIYQLIHNGEKILDNTIDNFLLFLIDYDTPINLDIIQFSNDHVWNDYEVDFNADGSNFLVETGKWSSNSPHHVLKVPSSFFTPRKKFMFGPHLFYISMKGSSSSNQYDTLNKEHILRIINFNERNLLDFNFYNLNPLRFFKTADKIAFSANENKSFLSTFKNTNSTPEDKLAFLEIVAERQGKLTLSDKTTFSKLYFDTAYISKEIEGIENFDFVKYPAYGKIVFAQIIQNIDLQNAFDDYYTSPQISYIDTSFSIHREERTVEISAYLKTVIIINDIPLLVSKITKMFDILDSEPTKIVIVASLLSKGNLTKKQFLSIITKMFPQPETYFFELDEHYANTNREIAGMLRKLCSLGKYSYYFIESFCENGHFAKATLAINNLTKPDTSSLKKIFVKYPILFATCNKELTSNIFISDLISSNPVIPRDVVLNQWQCHFMSSSTLLKIMNDDEIFKLIPTRKVLNIFVRNFTSFSNNEKNIFMKIFLNHKPIILSNESFISYLVTDRDWDKKQIPNKQGFIEMLIQTEGSLDTFDTIIALAKHLKLDLSPTFKTNYYYLIDGALDELFS